jgi:chemotaxis response regulator CheB
LTISSKIIVLWGGVAAMEIKADTRLDATGAAPARALRILVVEDDALIQMLVCETLVSMGHEICGAAFSEAEAIEAAAASRPDIMIVDANLGRGSGITAVGRILADRWTPHVFVSGAKLASEALHPRAVTLQKPFQDHDLARAMARALAG